MWMKDLAESGLPISGDGRLAVALAQSHESLAAATLRFEESQERNTGILSSLREWLDGFTGTAKPEDLNPIAAMLPDPGLESEVVGIMTDVQVQ